MDVQLRETEARRAELLEVLGAGDYGDRRERRLATRAAVERGLLRRESFVAR